MKSASEASAKFSIFDSLKKYFHNEIFDSLCGNGIPCLTGENNKYKGQKISTNKYKIKNKYKISTKSTISTW